MEKNPNNLKISGTLYHKDMYKQHGSVRFVEKPQTKSFKLNRLFGAGLTSISLAMFIYSYGSIVSRSLAFNLSGIKANTNIEVQAQEPKIEETKHIDEGSDYVLVIPSLNLKSKILLNVDPSSESDYSQALGEGVAQAKGTALPGEGSRVYLFAHSTNSLSFIERFNAIFYDLDILSLHEKIDIKHGSTIYQYEVTEKKIVSSKDTSWIQPKEGEELILQTCWPKGTNWKRLLVIAKPI